MHVSIDPDFGTIRVVVDLDSLPPIRLDGYEFIVDFHMENLDNN